MDQLPQVFVIDPILVYVSFIGAGFVVSAAMLFYAFRSRKDPLAYIKGLAGGTGMSALLAALGTQIGDGNHLGLQWLDAAILIGAGFVGGCVVCVAGSILFLETLVIHPLRVRYGVGYATRIRLSLFSGSEPIGELLRSVARRHDADRVWDEFALASTALLRELSDEWLNQVPVLLPAALGPGVPIDATHLLEIVERTLETPVKNLSARLGRTTLNFSVWRIAADRPQIEHLVSFPKQVKHGRKRPLPIWKFARAQLWPATLAGHALLVNRYMSLRAGAPSRWRYERRQLGRRYDAIGCMPIPCQGEHSPWGVLSVVNFDGTIPLDSELVKEILDRIAGLVDRNAHSAALRTIDQCRADQRGKGKSPGTP